MWRLIRYHDATETVVLVFRGGRRLTLSRRRDILSARGVCRINYFFGVGAATANQAERAPDQRWPRDGARCVFIRWEGRQAEHLAPCIAAHQLDRRRHRPREDNAEQPEQRPA